MSSLRQEPDWAEKVIRLIGVEANDDQLRRQIQKFVRCNGALGVVRAANVVARRRAIDEAAIANPWGYCIQVFNGSVARSVVLHQLLYLLENSLRSRVDALMAQSEGNDWYADVHAYLPRDIAPVFQSDDQLVDVQERGDSAAPPYPIRRFKHGVTFTERLPFWALKAIVTHNYPKGHLYELFSPPARDQRLDPAFVDSALDKIRSARNDVAHHRPVTPELYSQTRLRVHRLLQHLEFDVQRAEERVRHAVSALYDDLERLD